MSETEEDFTGTPPDRWTFPGVFCGTAGWRLTEASDESMVWVGEFGGEMTLSRQHVPGRTTEPVDLEETRRAHREYWGNEGAGLVSVETIADDPRLDEVFQTHPLAVIRSTFRRVRATWECSATAGVPRHAIPPSAGPRLLLDNDVVQELLRMANEARANH